MAARIRRKFLALALAFAMVMGIVPATPAMGAATVVDDLEETVEVNEPLEMTPLYLFGDDKCYNMEYCSGFSHPTDGTHTLDLYSNSEADVAYTDYNDDYTNESMEYWNSNCTYLFSSSNKIVFKAENAGTYIFHAMIYDWMVAEEIVVTRTIRVTVTSGATSAPTVTTSAVTDITETTATGNGDITALGTPNPIQHGVVWDTAENPTVALSTKTEEGAASATGAFTSDITGLAPGTTYYVRAYAANSAGTAYGGQVSFTTAAASGVWDGAADTSWYSDGPTSFTITTAEELAGLAELVNAGNAFEGKTITLGADIALNDTSGFAGWGAAPPANEWTPIAYDNESPSVYFMGTFDGGGHTISGLYAKETGSYSDPLALFGYTGSTAVVKDVVVTDCYVYGYVFCAGVVGYNNNGTISGCTVSGVIYGTDNNHGGISGCNNGTISGCINNASVTCSLSPGGIAGVNNGQIYDCYNTGDVTGIEDTYSDAGGIVGENNSTGEIANCYNLGAISGVVGAGGVAGYNQNGGTITNCYSAASVAGPSAAGLVGENEGEISYSYWNSGLFAGSGVDGGTATGCAPKSTVEMKAAAFADLLNAHKGVYSAWTTVTDDYPTFSAAPSLPTVTSISPTSGPTAGGTSVAITGTNFTGATGVTIGGSAATGVTVVNDTTITATTPGGSAGAKDVVVTTPAGTGTGTGIFTYIAPPGTTISSCALSVDTGADSADFITNTALQTISGTLSANLNTGEYVQVSLDNGGTWNTAVSSVGSDTWSVFLTLTGSDTLKVKVTNSVGSDGAIYSKAYVLDTSSPVISSVSVPGSGTYKAGQNLDFEIAFGEAVTVSTVGGTPYIQLTVGSSEKRAEYISGSGTASLLFRYTVGSGDSDEDGIAMGGNIILDGGTIKDTAGNDASAAFSAPPVSGVMVDGTAPTVTISSSAPNPTNTSPIPVTITFSEDVTGFTVGDLTVGNGTAGNFNSVDAKTYTADITPLSNGAVTVDISAGVATDLAGNDNTAAAQFTRTYDTAAPTVTISSSAPNPTNTSPIPVTITFSEDVTGFAVDGLTVGNGSAGSFNATDAKTYTANITPSANGDVTVDVNAGVAADLAGNGNSASAQFTKTYDTTAPTVTISSSALNPTNTSPIPVTITFSEDVTGFAVEDITVGNGAADNFNASTAKVYTVDIIPSANGDVTIDVNAGVAADAAGNGNTEAERLTRTYDGTAPTVTVTSSALNPTNTSPIPVTITFSKDVTGFAVGDITVGNGSADNFATTSARIYTAEITPSANGEVTVDISAGVAADAAGNGNTAAAQLTRTYDSASPTVTISSSAPNPTNTSPIPVTITFSENVTGFTVDDLTVGNGTAGNFNATDAKTYTAEITPSANGAVTVDINAGTAADLAGNGNSAAAQFTRTYDSAAPAVTISSSAPNPTNTSPIPVTITFSKDVTGFAVGDITVGNGSAGSFATTSARIYTADIMPTSDGTVTVDINAGVAADTAGNGNTAAAQLTRNYDGTAPAAGGAITVGAYTYSSVSLSWPAGTDALTAPENLQYQVVYSLNDNISTVIGAENYGTPAGSWTANITSATVSGLSASKTYYFNIIVKDETGNKAVYVPVSRATAAAPSDDDSSSGASGNTANNTGNTGGGAEVIVNGEPQDAGTAETITNPQGQTVTTVTVDTDKLNGILESKGTGSTVEIPVTGGSDVAVGVLTGDMVKSMEDKAATLVVQTDSATYTLPASEINIDAVSEQFGSNVSLSDITVTVEIASPSAAMIAAAESAAAAEGCSIVIPALSFTTSCTYNGQTVEVASFSDYVERMVAIPDGVDPDKITTGVVVDADGTMRHVPTRIEIIDGRYYAVINSLTNSTYTVVWNPVEFSDIESHWAKDAINDMGSRMVISGVGNNNFEPDRNMTRAEFAATIVRALGLAPASGESGFRDVNSSAWHCGYVKTASKYGVIAGYSDGTFGPDDLITREQAMAMIARAMKLTGIETGLADGEAKVLLDAYSDGTAVSEYAEESAAACLRAGIVSGKGESGIAPKSFVTRAEVAVMVQKLLQKSELI